jgi:hypothetical protein
MNTPEQAFINGFLKRAAEYGVDQQTAINLLKESELIGKQHKLDVDKDGKIEASDLAILRKKKEVKTK